MPDNLYKILSLKEKAGMPRSFEPISIGVPFPKGAYFKRSSIRLTDDDGERPPFAANVLDRWSDGSLKWVLLDLQISMPPNTQKTVFVQKTDSVDAHCSPKYVDVKETPTEFIVRNELSAFYFSKKIFTPFRKIEVNGSNQIVENGSETCLIDANRRLWHPYIESCQLECCNGLRATIYTEGHFRKNGKDDLNPLRFKSRVSFFGKHSFVKIGFTVWNPNSAHHPEGFWDLGNAGSFYFKELYINFLLSKGDVPKARWITNPKDFAKPGALPCLNESNTICIYQDSSGGENWQSCNHVNRHNIIPHLFRGYRVYESDRVIEEGLRASPILSVDDGARAVTGTMSHFWQNFPSAIEVDGNCLKISLFPSKFSDVFELQGGEQKTRQVFAHFADMGRGPEELVWVHHPLMIEPSTEWYCNSKAFSYVIQKRDIDTESLGEECFKLAETAIKGPDSFRNRREVIDEYGWRNFGDQYADHENRLYLGEKPIISHYNNQYDLLNSFLIQYISTGEVEWFDLAFELVRHVIDIDIYHTGKDRFAYNHGLFWHTDHFASAGTSTHRSFSRQTIIEDKDKSINDGPAAAYLHAGSGPSPQHLYTQGLKNYYYLTGDCEAKESVLELAEFTMNNIKGPTQFVEVAKALVKNTLKWVKKKVGKNGIIPYGLLEGPDRGSGNALNALLDAFDITKEMRYMSAADFLIEMCVHPKDNLSKRKLRDLNNRWSYVIFLQSVAKYLDLKIEAKNFDYMFFYARDVLVHYAKWMLNNEVLQMTHRDSFDFPNYETRAANDIRKANVLYLASKYVSADLRVEFKDAARLFFEEALETLFALETRTHTRPLAILLQNMHLSLFFGVFDHPEAYDVDIPKYDYGKPKDYDSLKATMNENLRILKNLALSGS